MNSKTEMKRRPRRADRAGELRVAAINRVADRIDLAIDLLTLGQYGLECHEAAAGTNGCEGSKRGLARSHVSLGRPLARRAGPVASGNGRSGPHPAAARSR